MLRTHWYGALLTGLLIAQTGITQRIWADEPVAKVTEGKSSKSEAPARLTAGDHTRNLVVDGQQRSYLVHVPRKYNSETATPVVLILHGAFTNAAIMVPFCGLNDKSDEAGFIAVYPNGTGPGMTLFFNAGSIPGLKKPDDVAFVDQLLDDLETVVNVDKRRVYATGMSNGGMMCYRLAAELSQRIAAIAPVAGTATTTDYHPKRPVPVLHFHGSADTIVPFSGTKQAGRHEWFCSVPDTIDSWCKINGCAEKSPAEVLADRASDGTQVERTVHGPGTDGAEVVLYRIVGGGHTWPGMPSPLTFLGKSTSDISGNDLIWEFFERHPLGQE
jgi:polyhydroxybutyrate depolymerase